MSTTIQNNEIIFLALSEFIEKKEKEAHLYDMGSDERARIEKIIQQATLQKELFQ